jgi:hypothetical protein
MNPKKGIKRIIARKEIAFQGIDVEKEALNECVYNKMDIPRRRIKVYYSLDDELVHVQYEGKKYIFGIS